MRDPLSPSDPEAELPAASDSSSDSGVMDGADLPEGRPCLYVVSTPIGNLLDITYRAVKVLKKVDLILAEDTRHSRILLQHHGVRVRSESYNDFNKEKRTPGYIAFLKEGHAVALICDAGTPGIADPAFNLIKAARAEGIRIAPVPGPSALLAALVGSGLPTDHFSFQNFPPKKSAARLRKLQVLKDRYADEAFAFAPTLAFYVSPHNVKQFLEEIGTVFGPAFHVVLARELTKKFEEFLADSVEGLLRHYAQRTPRGEYVLLFHPQGKR